MPIVCSRRATVSFVGTIIRVAWCARSRCTPGQRTRSSNATCVGEPRLSRVIRVPVTSLYARAGCVATRTAHLLPRTASIA